MASNGIYKLPAVNMSNVSQHPLNRVETREELLERVTSSPVMMTGDLFEKLYLQPFNEVKGNLRATFGNPTPLGLIGLVTALTPLACCLMGWRGAGGDGAAMIGVYFFMGGPCLVLAGIGEWILGNTFSFVVFFTYGTVFLALGATLQPFYNAAGSYANGDSVAGALTPEYNASLAYWPLMIAVLNLFWTICATRINLVFVLVFVTAGTGFATYTGALFATAEGAVNASAALVKGTGAFWFLTALLLWYLLLIQMLAVIGFEIELPVGDLSKRYAAKKQGHEKV